MDRLIEILEEVKSGVDYLEEDALITDGILKSFEIVSLVAKLNDEYGIEIGVADLVPENFETAQAIFDLIEKKEDE